MLLHDLRAEVAAANQRLETSGLVRWTSGNASARDPDTGYIAIKPSGVLFNELTPEKIVILDAKGAVVEGDLRPSVDSASHLYVYAACPEIGGIVHTHSRFATAFAVAGRPVPVTTTTHACILGGEVVCSGLAAIGEDAIGAQIVKYAPHGPAVLLRQHGVFTMGKSVDEAFKFAIYVEESAEASFLAETLAGQTPEQLSRDFIAECRRMYLEDYGQKPGKAES